MRRTPRPSSRPGRLAPHPALAAGQTGLAFPGKCRARRSLLRRPPAGPQRGRRQWLPQFLREKPLQLPPRPPRRASRAKGSGENSCQPQDLPHPRPCRGEAAAQSGQHGSGQQARRSCAFQRGAGSGWLAGLAARRASVVCIKSYGQSLALDLRRPFFASQPHVPFRAPATRAPATHAPATCGPAPEALRTPPTPARTPGERRLNAAGAEPERSALSDGDPRVTGDCLLVSGPPSFASCQNVAAPFLEAHPKTFGEWLPRSTLQSAGLNCRAMEEGCAVRVEPPHLYIGGGGGARRRRE